MKIRLMVKSLVLFLLGTALIASTSWATPVLTLDDGAGTSVSITDGGAGDLNPVAGAVTFVGTLGVWNINVSTGISATTGWLPDFHLDSVNNSTAGGTMEITFGDTDPTWTPGVPGFSFATGGVTSGTVSFEALVGGTSMSTLGPVTPSFPGTFALSDSFAYGGPTPASVLLVANIEHLAAGDTSFDLVLSPIPEPATMLLLGTGLVGVAGAVRRRKNNQA